MKTQQSWLGCISLGVLAVLLMFEGPARSEPQPSSLDDAYRIIAGKQFVDLTHTFSPNIPHWKGFTPEKVSTIYTYDKDGFLVQLFTHVGQ